MEAEVGEQQREADRVVVVVVGVVVVVVVAVVVVDAPDRGQLHKHQVMKIT
jgi:Mn2+/Fe2+ NRAMP family transporter